MTILLSATSLLMIFLTLNGRVRSPEDGREDWRGAFLRAMVIWGMVLTLSLEGLSLVDGITRTWVALTWVAVLGIVLWLGLRSGRIRRGWRRLFPVCKGWGSPEIFLLGSLILIMALLLLVAWVAPANNTDSLKYHMARVMHWTQSGNFNHFPTARLSQLVRPHWAEAAILNLRVLWGNDRPANLIQWFSLLGSVIGAAGIASLFGASRRGQILVAAFCMSIPMALLQSTSTQNDLAAAFWVICLAYFLVLSHKSGGPSESAWFVGGALGLGILTKGTFFPYAFPLTVWYILSLLFRVRWMDFVRSGLIIGTVVFILNLPFWSRNVISYGGIYGPAGSTNLNIDVGRFLPISRSEPASQPPIRGEPTPAPRSEGVVTPEIEPEEPEGLIGRLATQGRRVALLLGMHTVYPEVGWSLHRVMREVPDIYTPFFMDRLERGLWNHEDTAGSLLHLLFITLAILLLPTLWRSPGRNLLFAYVAAALAGYVMVSFISYSVNVFSVRYQLAFFILMAPLVGLIFSQEWLAKTTMVLAGFFVIASLPYVFVNNSRPLIDMRPERTRVGSILVEPREDIMFAVVPEIKEDYYTIRDAILEAGCTNVGLHLWNNDLEYLFWWMFEAPQSGMRLEVTQSILVPERDSTDLFEPCAVICTRCPDEIETLFGFPQAVDLMTLKLYMNPPGDW